jgi:hypothetical protein
LALLDPPTTHSDPFHATQLPVILSKGLDLTVHVIPSELVAIAAVLSIDAPVATHKDPSQAIPFP